MRRRHPLTIFFPVAYAISWSVWAPLWLPAFGVDGLPVIPFHHALGASGPIAAAFLVSWLEAGGQDSVISCGAWPSSASGSYGWPSPSSGRTHCSRWRVLPQFLWAEKAPR